jgi:GMP synthase-like glutamine amidotransferase
MRDVAILRFSGTEGPAYFAEWLDGHGIPWRLIPIDEGAAIPSDAAAFAGVGMMGGPMGVNDPLPWIEPVCALLRDAVAQQVPVIGHCLGGQLLAKALGAPVDRATTPEIGWIGVDIPPGPAQHEWFGDRVAFETFQWHYDAFALPAGATRVLTNRFNENQAYIVDNRHIGLQCHIEMTNDLVATWLHSGAGELPNVSTPSEQSADAIRSDLDARLATLHRVAGDVYARWAKGLRR